MLICEGETDNVYLTHAIRSLAGDFPTLVESARGGKVRLKVRIYKYPRSSTARLLGLKDGGSGVLGKFIAAYEKEIAHFAGPGLTEPVIVIYDNDNGAHSIRNVIKEVLKVMPSRTEPFMRVVKNLYAIPTPLQAYVESSRIEDFFDARTKETVIDGKTFKEGKDFDPNKNYGKKVFAHKVIKPNADTIDFAGFRPLLKNIVDAITAHRQSLLSSATLLSNSPQGE